ncbi:MAG: hypothetical protein WCT05_01120 [Lentisphaeria bacterium]
MDDDFNDVLSIFSDAPDKNEKAPLEEKTGSEPAVAESAKSAVPAAPALGTGLKKTLPGKGLQRPQPGGKFSRPSGVGSAPPAAVKPAVPPPPAPVASAPAVLLHPTLPGEAAKTAHPLPNVLLVLLVLFSLIGLLISAAALTKVSSLRKEMLLLNETMKQVKVSADRSWQIKCGIYVPVPNQRPQEYMIMYEEKDGQLVKKQMISRPME